jgi:hypothetical protein
MSEVEKKVAAAAPKRSFAEALKDTGMLFATPFISVAYMAMFPFFFLAMLFGIGGLGTRRR